MTHRTVFPVPETHADLARRVLLVNAEVLSRQRTTDASVVAACCTALEHVEEARTCLRYSRDGRRWPDLESSVLPTCWLDSAAVWLDHARETLWGTETPEGW